GAPSAASARGRKRLVGDQAISDGELAPLGLAGRNLEYGLRATTACSAPWLEIRCDLHDSEVAIEEHGVDRKAHEGHVHRRRRLQENSFTTRQVAPAEEPFHAHERCVREDTALTHNASVFAPKH